MTKLFYRGAKLVSYPIFMRGKKGFRYGRGLNIGYGCHFDLLNTQKVTLRIGENCEMGDWCHVVAIDEVKIGDNFLAASKVLSVIVAMVSMVMGQTSLILPPHREIES